MRLWAALIGMNGGLPKTLYPDYIVHPWKRPCGTNDIAKSLPLGTFLPLHIVQVLQCCLGRRLEPGGGQLCLLLPVIDQGMITNCSQCQRWISYCLAEVVNSSSFDTNDDVFFATPEFRERVSTLRSNRINSSTWPWRLWNWQMVPCMICYLKLCQS